MLKLTLSTGKTIKVSAKQSYKEANWSPSGDHYRITILVDGKRRSFDFWDSYANMVAGKDCDIQDALACFARDAFDGGNYADVDEIAAEFGYDKPSEATRVWKGLQKASKQAQDLGLSDDELIELSEEN